MTVCFVYGTRPELIKLAPVIRLCQENKLKYYIINAAQHTSFNMNMSFFDELGIVFKGFDLNVGYSSPGKQLGQLMTKIEDKIFACKPNCVIYVGDTNTVLAASLVAAKLGVPGVNIEAGLRCGNRKALPEELNRILANACSDILFCPTDKNAKNLVEEKNQGKIFVVGNTIVDSVKYIIERYKEPKILDKLNLFPQQYILTTIHRSETTNDKNKLKDILSGLGEVRQKFMKNVLFPMHPRTKDFVERYKIPVPPGIIVTEPVGYIDMLHLIQNSALVISDSGGIAEECAILNRPHVVARNETERDELITINASFGLGAGKKSIVDNAIRASKAPVGWEHPYGSNVGQKIFDILKKEVHKFEETVTESDDSVSKTVQGKQLKPTPIIKKAGKELASLIIVNYNTLELTINCVDSIKKNTKFPYEIIVVDSGSTDDSAEKLRKLEGIKFIESTWNKGYGGSLNKGFLVADGKYIFFLNSDLIMTEGWLKPLVDTIKQSDEIAFVGPKLINKNNQIMGAGVVGSVKKPVIRGWMEQDSPEKFNEQEDVVMLCGACFGCKREMFNMLGKFDERIFLYHEESTTGQRQILLKNEEDNLELLTMEKAFEKFSAINDIKTKNGVEYIEISGYDTLSCSGTERITDDNVTALDICNNWYENKDKKIPGQPSAQLRFNYKKKLTTGLYRTIPVWDKIKYIARHKTSKKVYQVRSPRGETEVTEDHSMVQIVDGKLQKVKPRDMDKICTLKNLPEIKTISCIDLSKFHSDIKLTIKTEDGTMKKFLTLMAAYISEGCYIQQNNNATMSSSNHKFMAESLLSYNELFDGKSNLNDIKLVNGRTVPLKRFSSYGNCARLLSKMCGVGSGNKKIPEWVLQLDEEHLTYFLDKLLLGDGTDTKTKSFDNYSDKFKENHKRYSTTSKQVGAMMCLIRQKLRKKFAMNVSDRSKDLTEFTSYNIDSYKYEKPKIKEIDYGGYVYDLETKDTHIFVDVMGGVVLHNTLIECLALKRGYRNVYQPKSKIFHLWDKSPKGDNTQKRKYFEESKKIYEEVLGDFKNDETMKYPKKYRLLATVIGKNEAGRYLKEVMDHMSKYVDEIIFLDNGSTDNTIDIVKSYPKVVKIIEDDRPFHKQEPELRKKMLDAVSERNPDWVIAIDCDEILEDKGITQLKELMKNPIKKDAIYSFSFHHFWGNRIEFRTDGYWNPNSSIGPRMFQYSGQKFEFGKDGLHKGSIPPSVLQHGTIIYSGLRMKHLGYANKDDIQAKYDYYTKNDPNPDAIHKSHYGSIIRKPQLERWTE